MNNSFTIVRKIENPPRLMSFSKAQKPIFLRVFILLAFALAFTLLSACSVTKKIQTANVLKKCEFSFLRADIDSFSGDSLKFSIFLNANNKGKDSLFVKSLNGIARLDSLFEIPVSLSKSAQLSPGNNSLQFQGTVQLDLFKILALPNVKKFNIKGKAAVALKQEQETTDIDFDEERDVPPEMATKIIQRLVSGGR